LKMAIEIVEKIPFKMVDLSIVIWLYVYRRVVLLDPYTASSDRVSSQCKHGKSFDKCCRMKYEHIHHGPLAPLGPFRSRSWYPCSEM
jgi:hypothetical protein